MGQEEEAVPVPAPVAVVFSWEHEPAVPKPVSTPAVEARGMPESPRKARRLSVPPPPGRPATRSFSRTGRSVRPEDDPFLAAYLACTKSSGGSEGGGGGKRTAREPKGPRRFTWAGLGLGLSCKRSNGVVEESMVRLAKLPEVDPRDA